MSSATQRRAFCPGSGTKLICILPVAEITVTGTLRTSRRSLLPPGGKDLQMMIICFPALLSRSTILCIFRTKGQVTSTNGNSRSLQHIINPAAHAVGTDHNRPFTKLRNVLFLRSPVTPFFSKSETHLFIMDDRTQRINRRQTPFSISSYTLSTALFTPKQKPAVFAVLTFIFFQPRLIISLFHEKSVKYVLPLPQWSFQRNLPEPHPQPA